jgi:hypothetical protein
MDGALLVNMGETQVALFIYFCIYFGNCSLVLNDTISIAKRLVGVYMEEQWRHGLCVRT